MSTRPPDITLRELEARLSYPPAPGSFTPHEVEGIPDPARRYLEAAIAPGSPLAQAARLRMRGSIKVGRRWLSFRARQVLAPHHGFVWAARAGGVIAGSDRYADGSGVMDWKILGLVRLAHGEGPDFSRSAAGRAGAEAVWAPTALLPRFGVTWTAADARNVTASYRLDDSEYELRISLDDEARPQALVFDRWGDPENTGTWGYHPFGFDVTAHATFEGVTIPAAGRAGWFFGTDRWHDGEFFRSEITEYHLVTEVIA